MRTLLDCTALTGDPDALRSQAMRDGCLFLRGIPGAEAVAPLAALVRQVAEALGFVLPDAEIRSPPCVRPGAALDGTGYDDPRWLELQQRVLPDPRFAAVGDHPELLRVIEILFGESPLTRRGDICRIALPGAPHLTTPPHQDHWYTGGSMNLWTTWIALSDAPLELGPLAVLPGSHRAGLLPHGGEGAGRQGVHVPDASEFAAAPLVAGDSILLNCLTVHCALPNLTRDRVRVSVDYRYQPASEPIHVARVDGTRAGP
ncbi:MAG: phytanoyl-CoA dioxygenase family protein [Ideonella sp.]|nr:phytanoyl-CoA dioxygenase family protein [Ideonella sp.]MCC6727926.1 phytanoyl-CoA dioxygenase family protein [Chthonomonadales bacterium]